MWTSERSRRPAQEEPAAELGTVTLGGDPAGVLLGGERRWLSVCAPGGYSWRPSVGDKVLVIQSGGERETPCVAGAVQSGGESLGPGEVSIRGGSSQLRLGQTELALNGHVKVNGMDLELYIREIVNEMLSGLGG